MIPGGFGHYELVLVAMVGLVVIAIFLLPRLMKR